MTQELEMNSIRFKKLILDKMFIYVVAYPFDLV